MKVTFTIAASLLLVNLCWANPVPESNSNDADFQKKIISVYEKYGGPLEKAESKLINALSEKGIENDAKLKAKIEEILKGIFENNKTKIETMVENLPKPYKTILNELLGNEGKNEVNSLKTKKISTGKDIAELLADKERVAKLNMHELMLVDMLTSSAVFAM